MKAKPTQEHNGGFAVIIVLVLSLMLFSLLSLAVTASYWLHSINRHALADLQKKAATTVSQNGK